MYDDTVAQLQTKIFNFIPFGLLFSLTFLSLSLSLSELLPLHAFSHISLSRSKLTLVLDWIRSGHGMAIDMDFGFWINRDQKLWWCGFESVGCMGHGLGDGFGLVD